jgi:hypothetical protein
MVHPFRMPSSSAWCPSTDEIHDFKIVEGSPFLGFHIFIVPPGNMSDFHHIFKVVRSSKLKRTSTPKC